MIESVSGIFVFKCVDGLWGREAENAILYLYRKALILASELIRPPRGGGAGRKKKRGACWLYWVFNLLIYIQTPPSEGGGGGGALVVEVNK